jgi:thiol:disulfide interchange protein
MSRKYWFLVSGFLIAAVLVLAAGVVLAAKPKPKPKPAPKPTAIVWLTDFKAASDQAAKSKKPMMIDFYTDWCGWCKKLDSDTYTDSAVIDLSTKFVCVKVNADKFPDIAKSYKIEGYPTIVFTDSSAAEIHRQVGYQGPKEFAQTMKDALGKLPK